MRFEKPRMCRDYHKKEEEADVIEIAAPPKSLPLEWRAFAQEIEAARSLKPSKRYVNEFCHKLETRLDKEQVRQQIISEYLQETAWRRWMMRGLAAAAMLALVVTCEVQREEIDSLKMQLHGVEKRLGDSLPISPRLNSHAHAIRNALGGTFS